MEINTEKNFKQLVLDDIKGCISIEDAAKLRLPENLDAWKLTLNGLLDNLNQQFLLNQAKAHEMQSQCLALGNDGRKKWFEYHAKYLHWKRTAVRFKSFVESKIVEAKKLKKQHEKQKQSEPIKDLLQEAIEIIKYGNPRDAITRLEQLKESW